jgi:lysophospholipase L1-like esterase
LIKHFSAKVGFWAFLPLSALQGLKLRHTATRLPEAEGDRSGFTGQGRSLQLLAMGDSIIAGVGTGTMQHSLPVQFAKALAKIRNCCVHWQVDGETGADISQLRHRIRQTAQDQKADVILISIGVNNVTGLCSTRQWRLELNALVTEIKSRWPQARLIFVGLPPMGQFPLPPQPLRFTLGRRAATLDGIAASVIAQHAGMLHIPTDIRPDQQEFCEDGFHPSAKSCANWAKELAHRIEAANLLS